MKFWYHFSLSAIVVLYNLNGLGSKLYWGFHGLKLCAGLFLINLRHVEQRAALQNNAHFQMWPKLIAVVGLRIFLCELQAHAGFLCMLWEIPLQRPEIQRSHCRAANTYSLLRLYDIGGTRI